jgi:hypothetical protein
MNNIKLGYIFIFTLVFLSVFAPVSVEKILLINGFFALLFMFSLIRYFKAVKAVPESAWQMRKSEVAPDAELINVEVRAKDGSKKIIWRVRPDAVDFTDSASEPVISFMIVPSAPVASEPSN